MKRELAGGESGSIFWLTWPAIGMIALVLLLVVELAAYLVAYERAQTAADVAALAAVAATDPGADVPRDPWRVAEEAALANGAELRGCDCWGREVRVWAAVPVRGLSVTRFASQYVEATASARLVRAD